MLFVTQTLFVYLLIRYRNVVLNVLVLEINISVMLVVFGFFLVQVRIRKNLYWNIFGWIISVVDSSVTVISFAISEII